MRRLLVFPLLVVVLASLAPSAAVRADDPAPQPLGTMMGMVVRDPHYEWNTNPKYANDVNRDFYDTMGVQLQNGGVKWVRIEIFAEEFGSNPGTVTTEKYRYFINEVAPRHGIKVLALLATPLVRWQNGENQGKYLDPELLEAPSDDPPSNDPLACGKPSNDARYPYGCGTNAYMRIWLNNAFHVAQTFPYNPATGAGIAAFEVLNEENRYLNGGGKGLKPSAVATMLTKFYRIYKNVRCPAGSLGSGCSQVKIILGGLHPDRCDDCAAGGFNDRQYLNAIYTSAPFQGYRSTYGKYPVDGIGYHPYPMEMRSGLVPEPTGSLDLFRVPGRMKAMREVMVQNLDSANKFWITEIGDRGAPISVDPAGDNERRQAQFMRSVYWFLWRNREFVENIFWFKYEDFAVPSDPDATGPENWGVVRIKPGTTSEYDTNGTVERYKQSFSTYQSLAFTGLREYHTYVPTAINE
jgi:hypothetical protein